MDNSFRTYKKLKACKFSNGTIYALVCLGSLLILLLNDELSFFQFDVIEKIFRIAVLIFFLLLVYKTFKSFNEIEEIDGKITGSLELFQNKILINKQIIVLSEIDNIELHILDYNGKRNWILIDTWFPSLSNGFGNILSIKLINKENLKTNFEQNYKDEFIRKNKEILIDYYKLRKISLTNLLDVLGIDDYDEIQKFKNSLN